MREDGGIESEVLANQRAVDVMVVNPAMVIRIELTKHIKGKLTVRKEKPSSKILECIL
jgi:Holliday junction resolvase